MPQSDTQTGTPVVLVVQPQQVTPGTPGHTTPPPLPPPPHHLPFTGADVVPVLALGAALVAAGGLLTGLSRALRQPVPVRSSVRSSR